MKSRTEELINELTDALSSLGMNSDADDIKRFKLQLMSKSSLERKAAAKHIDDRCHVKWYSDMNLPVKRKGDYPVYVFLDELRTAVRSEVQ